MYLFEYHSAQTQPTLLQDIFEGQQRCYEAFGAKSAALVPGPLEGITLFTVRSQQHDQDYQLLGHLQLAGEWAGLMNHLPYQIS